MVTSPCTFARHAARSRGANSLSRINRASSGVRRRKVLDAVKDLHAAPAADAVSAARLADGHLALVGRGENGGAGPDIALLAERYKPDFGH